MEISRREFFRDIFAKQTLRRLLSSAADGLAALGVVKIQPQTAEDAGLELGSKINSHSSRMSETSVRTDIPPSAERIEGLFDNEESGNQ